MLIWTNTHFPVFADGMDGHIEGRGVIASPTGARWVCKDSNIQSSEKRTSAVPEHANYSANVQNYGIIVIE